MKIRILLALLSLCSCFLVKASFAQSVGSDTAFLQSSVNKAVALYDQSMGKHIHLYNGLEYVDYRKPYFEGHQFFYSDELTHGAVFYDGVWYKQVPMLYDIVMDEVVVGHQDSGLKQRLVTEKVDTFRLHDHTYIRLGEAALQPDFYDLIHSNKTKVLVKRSKSSQQKATSTGMEGRFDLGEKYYLWKDSAYTQVSGKRSVLKVFQDEKKQLQKHIRANKIKFKKSQREAAIRELARFYDSLQVQAVAEE